MNIIPKFLPKGHYEKGRKQYRPEIIVLHIGEGLQNQIYLEFLNTEKSSHYCVARNGEVWQFVKEGDTAWGNGEVIKPTAKKILEKGDINPNLYSISIEHEGYGHEGINELQYQATAKLIQEISERWLIPLDREHIIGHREIKAIKICPGKIDISRLISMAYPLKPEEKIIKLKVQISILQRLIELIKKLNFLKTMDRKFGAFSSSIDPQKLSRTWAGILNLIPALTLLSSWYGVELGEGEILAVLTSVKDLAIAGYVFVGSLQVAFGLVRKLFAKFKE